MVTRLPGTSRLTSPNINHWTIGGVKSTLQLSSPKGAGKIASSLAADIGRIWKGHVYFFFKWRILHFLGVKTNIAPENGWLEDESFPFLLG